MIIHTPWKPFSRNMLLYINIFGLKTQLKTTLEKRNAYFISFEFSTELNALIRLVICRFIEFKNRLKNHFKITIIFWSYLSWVTSLIFCMNIVYNNVHNQKWPIGLMDRIVKVSFLTFCQKQARNWSLRLPTEWRHGFWPQH